MKKPSKRLQAPKLPSAKARIAKAKAILPPVPARFKKQTLQEQTKEALENVPRITNETIAEHRENVLRGARKYKYPLQHSKRKIVIISSALLVVAVVGFLAFTLLSLYKFQSTSTLTYRVTQLIPFPIARADGRFVSYESYLFQLRRYMHYYETQQQVNFSDKSGKEQLETQKPKALQQVVQAAYVKELADKHHISVSDAEVNREVDLLRAQSQLTNSDKELESVIQRFYGWSLNDLKREIKQNLLEEKVAAQLDTVATSRIHDAQNRLQAGADFGELAKEISDDTNTKANGGVYNDTAITMSSQEVPPEVVMQLGTMKPGEISDIIVTPTAYEIVKLISVDNGKYKAAHIQINFQDISTYVTPLEKQHPAHYYIHVQPLQQQTIPKI